MTGRELAIYAHSLRVTASSLAAAANEHIGPRAADDASAALRRLANEFELAAGRKLVREVLNP